MRRHPRKKVDEGDGKPASDATRLPPLVPSRRPLLKSRRLTRLPTPSLRLACLPPGTYFSRR
jgi:hypothetical protein